MSLVNARLGDAEDRKTKCRVAAEPALLFSLVSHEPVFQAHTYVLNDVLYIHVISSVRTCMCECLYTYNGPSVYMFVYI